MTDDTLSQGYGFQRSTIVKTKMAAQERFCLASLAKNGEAGMATVRRLLCDGMAANGWPEDVRIMAYAEYAASCLRTGKLNEYEDR